jgi:hypothetical protein
MSVSTAFRNDKGDPPTAVVAPGLPKGLLPIPARIPKHPGISAGDSNGAFGPENGSFFERCRNA